MVKNESFFDVNLKFKFKKMTEKIDKKQINPTKYIK